MNFRLGFFILILVFIFSMQTFAQQRFVDIFYLRSGAILTGTIMDSKSADSLHIRALNDSIYIIEKTQVQRISTVQYKMVDDVPFVMFKNPGIACMLSVLMPGIGQYNNGQYWKGATQQALSLSGVVIGLAGVMNSIWTDPHTRRKGEKVAYVGFSILLVTRLWSIIDAPISSNRINKKLHAKLNFKH